MSSPAAAAASPSGSKSDASAETAASTSVHHLHTDCSWYIGRYSASVCINASDFEAIQRLAGKTTTTTTTITTTQVPFRGSDSDEENWIASFSQALPRGVFSQYGQPTGASKLQISFQRNSQVKIQIFVGSAIVTFDTLPMLSAQCTIGDAENGTIVCSIPWFDFPEENFKIFFSVSYGVVCRDEESRPSLRFEEGESELCSAFEDLFLDGKGSDVCFIIGEEVIPAHKAVLIARVPCFDKMMSSGMTESESNTIVIKDADAVTFKEVLKYIYCAKLPAKLEENALQILPLADKYDLQRLKEACVHAMDVCLTKENVIDILIMADLHRCDELKRKCLKSLGDWKSSMDTQDLERLLKEFPHLMIDLIKTA